MKFVGGKSIIASYALVAAAGVGAMVGLVCLINVDTSKPRQQTLIVRKHVKLLTPSVNRWAFAPSDAFAALPELRPSFAPGSDFAEADPNQVSAEADPSHVSAETASWATETVAPPWQTDAHSTPVTRTIHREQADNDDRPQRRRPYSRSLEKRLAEISPGAMARLKKKFEDAKVAWPPSEIALIGIKDEKILELHARSKGQPWQLIHRYRILAASGGTGPKLRQGDKQVPEGIYRIAWLNPNSAYHVSLRVSYPNAFDRKMAKKEGRSNLGGDIMIHGKNLSAGCLAIGDEAVEEIFTVAAETGLAKVRVIIAPTDLRTKGVPQPKPGQPEWVPKLYTEIASAMSGYESVNPIATGSTNIASSFMSFFSK
jgi:hypothetical protein